MNKNLLPKNEINNSDQYVSKYDSPILYDYSSENVKGLELVSDVRSSSRRNGCAVVDYPERYSFLIGRDVMYNVLMYAYCQIALNDEEVPVYNLN